MRMSRDEIVALIKMTNRCRCPEASVTGRIIALRAIAYASDTKWDRRGWCEIWANSIEEKKINGDRKILGSKLWNMTDEIIDAYLGGE